MYLPTCICLFLQTLRHKLFAKSFYHSNDDISTKTEHHACHKVYNSPLSFFYKIYAFENGSTCMCIINQIFKILCPPKCKRFRVKKAFDLKNMASLNLVGSLKRMHFGQIIKFRTILFQINFSYYHTFNVKFEVIINFSKLENFI